MRTDFGADSLISFLLGIFDYRIWILLHGETGLTFVNRMDFFTESETGFTTDPKPD